MLTLPYTTQAITLLGAPGTTQALLAHRDRAQLLLAGAGDPPLAAFTTWRNAMHPTLLRFTFALTADGAAAEPALVADGLLTAVIEVAKTVKARGLALSTAPTMTPLMSAMVSRGLRRVRTTFSPVLPLETVGLPTTALPAGAVLHSSAALTQQPGLQQALLTQSYAAYEASHRINPVAPYRAGAWASAILDDLVPDIPLVMTRDGALQAYCLVYTATPSAVDFGYAWGATPEALDALAQQTLSSLGGLYQTLNGEFDDTDPFALQVARLFPADLRTDGELATYTMIF